MLKYIIVLNTIVIMKTSINLNISKITWIFELSLYTYHVTSESNPRIYIFYLFQVLKYYITKNNNPALNFQINQCKRRYYGNKNWQELKGVFFPISLFCFFLVCASLSKESFTIIVPAFVFFKIFIFRKWSIKCF